MKKKPVFIAFSTQKGGVGKTTFTVLTASYLHYACGYNLIVVDCDYPQFSINAMRQRDVQGVDRNPALQELVATQFSELQKSTYTILCATAEAAVDTVREYLKTHEPDMDFVFFDLPGTINNDGVLTTLSGMDYIFTPISADRIALESTLFFQPSSRRRLPIMLTLPTKGFTSFGIWWTAGKKLPSMRCMKQPLPSWDFLS
jgi:cellulose biosynthesis protein BcsQ